MQSNHVSLRINSLAEPILFADDTGVLISNSNLTEFSTTANLILARMIEWFSASRLVSNLEKTNVLKFVTNNLPYCAMTIGHKDKYIQEAVHLKFLGIQINWKNHIDQIIPKLSAAGYMVKQMYYICNNDTFRSIYFACFHSIASHGIILGRNSSYSKKIFTLQKRKIRIMVGAHPRISCRRLFKKLEIFTVPSQYMYSLMSFSLGIRKNFRLIRQCITLIQDISTIFIDPLLTCRVFRKVHPIWGSEFLTAYHKLLQILRMKRHNLK